MTIKRQTAQCYSISITLDCKGTRVDLLRHRECMVPCSRRRAKDDSFVSSHSCPGEGARHPRTPISRRVDERIAPHAMHRRAASRSMHGTHPPPSPHMRKPNVTRRKRMILSHHYGERRPGSQSAIYIPYQSSNIIKPQLKFPNGSRHGLCADVDATRQRQTRARARRM